jgi:hypothetical protein
VVDQRLLDHWRRARRARERARASLPASWQRDPRPAMVEVREAYVEGIVDMRRATSTSDR